MVEIMTKKRPQRPPKIEAYQKVNSYSLRPSKQQILTAILFLVLLSIHQIFITSTVKQVEEAILWMILGFRYVLLLLVVYDYIKLTIKDPVDRLIIDPNHRYKFSPYELRKCSICATTVQCSSHHCMTCNRCTEDFDHHCKYLNNCIGVRNYENFVRILFTFSFFLLLSVAMAVWILVKNQIEFYLTMGQKVVIIIYAIFSFIISVVVLSLLGFHIYISCCAKITTLQWIISPKTDVKPPLGVIVVQPVPLSAENLRKTFEDRNNNQNRHVVKFITTQPSGNQQMTYYRK